MASFVSVAGPKPKLSPMQPRPIAETSKPLFPSLRVSMTFLFPAPTAPLASDASSYFQSGICGAYFAM
jgi:hypothetical protein